MNKNICSKGLLSIALVLSLSMGINCVYADGIPGVGTDGDHEEYDDVGTTNPDYENERRDGWLGNYNGLKISIVSSKGGMLATKLYATSELNSYIKGKNVKVYQENLDGSHIYSNRVYSNVRGVPYSDDNWVSNPGLESLGNLEKIFMDSGFKVSFSNSVSSLNLGADQLFSGLYRKNYSGGLDYTKALIKVVSDITGYDESMLKKYYYDKDTNEMNLFIVYEPVTLIYYYNSDLTDVYEYYIGTSYELSSFLKTRKSSGIGGITASEVNTLQGMKAFADLGTVTGVKLGCSVYLTGSLAGKMQTLRGSALSGFTNTSYFNNNLKIDSAYINICKTVNSRDKWTNMTSIYQYVTNSRYGLGVGVIWFGELYGEEINCDDLNKELEKDYPGFTSLAVSDITDSMFTKYNKKNNKQWTTKTYLEACPRTMNCDTINSALGITPYITLDQAKSYASQLKSYNMTPDDYCSACGCNDITIQYDCTPRIDTSNCDSGESTIYSDANGRENDQDYWNYCVFNDIGYYTIDNHKSSSDFKDSALGSDYCEVYCIEDLSISLAKGRITALAGRYFTLPDSTISGSRTCKTKSVNYTQYETDIKNDKTDIDKAFSDLNAVISFNNSLNNGHWGNEKENKGSTLKKIDDNFATQDILDDGTFNGSEYEGKWVTTYCFKDDSNECKRRSTEDTGKVWCDALNGPEGAGCYVNEQSTSSYTYTWVNSNGNEYTLPTLNNPQNISLTKTVDSRISDTKSDAPSGYNVSDYENKLNDAIKNRDEHIEDMKKCYTWDANKIYQTNASVEITYNFDSNYVITDHRLQSSVLEDNLTQDLDCTNTTVDKYTYSCDNNGCVLKPTSESIKKCNTVTMNRYILNAYDADTFEYVEKSTKSINSYTEISRTVAKNSDNNFYTIFKTITKTTESDMITNYIKIDIPNFPVSFSLKPGLYGYELKSYDIGHNTTSAKLNDIIGQNDSSYSLLNCSIEIKEGLFRNNENTTENTKCVGTGCGGIKIIYREIDLARPFPNIDDSNRDTGSNWCSGVSCSWNNGVVEKYILNNRNVTGSDVYNQTPMYTFIMTPSDVIEIRKYNNSNSYESYKGADNSQTYDYKCNQGTGNACISDYLTHLLDILDSNNLPGTCKDDKTRTYTDVASFNNCRY